MPTSEMSNPEPPCLDVARVRDDFVALQAQVHGHPLVYLDNASTTQKPRAVLDALRGAYEAECANIHRGVHSLSAQATRSFEAVRSQVATFLGGAPDEVIFTHGTTEAINLVAQSYGRSTLQPGDRVLVSEMEHHSNLVPWQMLCAQTGAQLDILPMDPRGILQLDLLEGLLGPRTRIVAVAHASNSLGTVHPVAEICRRARAQGAVTVVDGAQAVPHLPVQVADLDCDFYAFSAHKLYGPTGVGVLWGRRALLQSMPPWQGGGEMISSVSLQGADYADPPQRFEAGTPNIFGVMGLGAALTYVQGLGLKGIIAHEARLLAQATEALSALPGVQLVGTAPHKVPVLSFVVQGAHPHDVGTILDLEGVAVRTGHHCTEPVMRRLGLPGTVRASFGLYNTEEEVQALVQAVLRAQAVLT